MRTETDIEIYLRSPRMSALCPRCEQACRKVYDRKTRRVVHGVLNGKKVILVVKQRRFACVCGKIFTEAITGISRRRYSKQVQDQCVRELKGSTFKSVSTTYGISAPTLVSFLKERSYALEMPPGDLKLNVDEHSFSGRDMKITIGESNEKRLLAVLRNDKQETLRAYLRSLSGAEKQRVSEVCIDMRASYLSVLKEELPKTLIVVDHFHVIREMIRQCDEVRRVLQPSGERGWRRINRWLLIKNREHLSKKEREELERIFEQYRRYPALKQCYLIKERVRNMYLLKDRAQAEQELNKMILVLEQLPDGIPHKMGDTLKRWKPYILNYFVSMTTNAFIEGCHNKIKLIKRMSYGFRNFENYVMKITLAFLPFLVGNLPH